MYLYQACTCLTQADFNYPLGACLIQVGLYKMGPDLWDWFGRENEGSLELSQQDCSNEESQLMFVWRNLENYS